MSHWRRIVESVDHPKYDNDAMRLRDEFGRMAAGREIQDGIVNIYMNLLQVSSYAYCAVWAKARPTPIRSCCSN